MTRNRLGSPNALMPWTQLALKTSEMWWASGQVIAHRTARMAAAGTPLSNRDRREFTLMGQEKMEASAESVQAMAAQMMSVNAMAAAGALRTFTTAARLLASMSVTAAPLSLSRQMSLVQAMARAVTPSAALRGSAARIAQHGLKPIHSRAVANAKRLSKL